MNVLSYFDGCSGAQQALERLDFKVDNYFACEIDKYAIQVTQKNYPNTIQLGSVIGLDLSQLPKIDLFCGGSPCQSFSFAGKRKGMATKSEIEILTLEHYLQLKNDGFEFEGQSYLFWEYMNALTQLRKVNPDIKFLLENVEMGEKWERVISKAIGVNGIHINSALVSAQNRKRIYWTNIGMVPGGLFGELESIITQPKDKGILLKDILEKEVDSKYYLSEKMIQGMGIQNIKNKERGNGFNFKPKSIEEKGNTITNPSKIRVDDNYIVHNTMPRSSTTGKGGTGHLSRNDGKTYCLDTGNTNAVEIVGALKFGRTEEAKVQRKESLKNGKDYTPFQSKEITSIDYEKMGTLVTTGSKDNLVYSAFGADFRKDEGLRIRDSEKSGTLMARAREDIYGTGLVVYNTSIRRLTPIECERLQTMKDNYTQGVSDSQRYKMIGNGWNIDTICHIFSYLND